MKKAIAIVLTCILALTMIAACNDNGGTSGSQPTPNATPQATPQATPPSQGPGPAVPPDFDTDRVIGVFTREDGSGTRDAFVSITGVGDDMYIEAVVQNGTSLIRTSVETNETAIGYISVGSLNASVKALEIEGILPSDASIMDGSYALQRPFLVVVNPEKETDPLVADFIAFMLSVEGQAISATSWTPVPGTPAEYVSPGGLSGTLKVGGSTSMDGIMQEMRQAYIVHNPNVDIEISGGGSGNGISEGRSGILDIGMSSRNLRDNEKENLKDIAIALDGVAVIVNVANPITGMSIEQVKDIFTGDVTRWNQLS